MGERKKFIYQYDMNVSARRWLWMYRMKALIERCHWAIYCGKVKLHGNILSSLAMGLFPLTI